MNACPSFDDLRRDKRVNGIAFKVAEHLHRFTKRCYDESFKATQTIADFLGVHVRTVQRALRALALAGYLLVIRDRSLNSGHRLRLLWRSATVFPSMRPVSPGSPPAPDASENGNVDAAAATVLSPPAEVPPDPPLKVSEDGSPGGRTDEAAARDPACGHPAPEDAPSSSPPAFGSLPPEDEEPEPDQVAELVREAAPVLGEGPAVEGRVRQMARRYTPAWVKKALGITARKAARLENPIGYTFGVLRRFEAEGGPPESATRAASPEEEDAAWDFILGPRTPCPGAGP